MKLNIKLIILALVIIAVVGYLYYRREHYGGGGYGIISGLAFNNNAKHCFKNFYDPPDSPGYCTTIGTVVV